jgi:lactoylglutathione lyase
MPKALCSEAISEANPGEESMEYLHTMIRVTDLKATIAFFELMGFAETRRIDNEKARYTLVFLAAPDDVEQAKASRKPTVELTYNWDPEPYTGGRNFGHLAYAVDDIYAVCQRLLDGGVTINRPPRDGHMAFIRSPDGISIELLQDGRLEPREPWASMPNTGSW